MSWIKVSENLPNDDSDVLVYHSHHDHITVGMNCTKCGSECMLCPADWPYQTEFWICPDCESTFVKEEK